ncbi:uncharacterized protein LOC135345011 [Halichondria panicea]|uniref:uncharacterized protein LOC135345011 n=1 Tax=Halichondria panicea TaxID=6063 RepID=UPI00312B7E55
MKCFSTLLILTALSATALAHNNGAIPITINGQDVTKYVLSTDNDMNNVKVSNRTITLVAGGRVYIGNSASDKLDTASYYDFDLQDTTSQGKRLTFNVDMSEVGCSCNGALYLVSMPAYNSAQQPEPGKDGSYYCDANQVGGTYCPEMDVMEANKYAMASTAHTCNYVAPHYYSTCDRGGCGTNVLDDHKDEFGPGKKIDTNKPFTVSVTFMKGGDNKLSSIENKFEQGGQSITFNACNSDYLQWMGYSLPGIVMTMSLWGTPAGGMSWLDGKSGCQGGCNLPGSRVSFSNIRIDNV